MKHCFCSYNSPIKVSHIALRQHHFHCAPHFAPSIQQCDCSMMQGGNEILFEFAYVIIIFRAVFSFGLSHHTSMCSDSVILLLCLSLLAI